MADGTVVYRQKGRLCVTRLITFRCNSNCLCCIAPMESRQKSEYSWRELEDIIMSIPADARTVDLNGGEPTATPHLGRAISAVARRCPGAEISILTNGRAFSYPGYLKALRLPRRCRFLVGLYGHTARLHDSMTQAEGSFSQAVKGIRNLLGQGMRVEVRVIVTRMNYRHLPSIARFMRRSFKSARLVFVSAKYTGQAWKNRKKLFVRISSVVPFIMKAEGHARDIWLYHFPLCLLPEGLRQLSPGMTVPIHDAAFGPQCGSCEERRRCPGVWKSYSRLAGFAELKPIRSHSKVSSGASR